MLVVLSTAEQTTPYAPYPTLFVNSYLSSTVKRLPTLSFNNLWSIFQDINDMLELWSLTCTYKLRFAFDRWLQRSINRRRVWSPSHRLNKEGSSYILRTSGTKLRWREIRRGFLSWGWRLLATILSADNFATLFCLATVFIVFALAQRVVRCEG